MLKKICTQIAIMLLCTVQGSSLKAQNVTQCTVTGYVINEKTGEPIEYATVILQKDNEQIGGITDSQGSFLLYVTQKVEYKIIIQFIGYKKFENNIQVNKPLIELGEIKMEEDTINLKEVVVVAEKSKLVTEMGKQTLYVGSDIGNAGNSTLNALENFPSVVVGLQGDIAVRGSSNVVIYVNGKPTNKNGKSLKHIPADLVKKIELVTNPSAQYGAEGVAGIINIVLKKDRSKSFQLKLNGYSQLRTDPTNFSHKLSTSLSYNHNDFTFYFNGGVNPKKYRNSPSVNRKCLIDDCDFELYRFSEIRDGKQNDLSANIGMIWELSPQSTFEIEADLQYWNIKERASEINQFTHFQQDDVLYELHKEELEEKKDYQFSSSFNTKWNEKNNLLIQLQAGTDTWDTSLKNNLNNMDLSQSPLEFSRITEQDLDNEKDYVLHTRTTRKENYGEWIIGSLHKMSTYSRNQSISYFDPVIVPDNVLDVKSWQHAPFVEFSKKTSTITYNVGLRYEYFKQNINQEFQDFTSEKRYSNLFPSAQFLYKMNEQHKVGLTYSKRIRYPQLSQLNPYQFYISPLFLLEGNPDLEASVSSNFELLHESKFKNSTIGSTLFARFGKNVIRQDIKDAPTADELIQTYVNDGKVFVSGAEFVFDISPINWLTLNQQVVVYYSEFNSPNAVFQNQLAASFRAFQEIKLPNDLKIQVRETYNSPTVNAQRKKLGDLEIELTARKKFKNNKWEMSFRFEDIFSTKRITHRSFTNNYEFERNLKFQFQRILLGFSYKLNE